MLSKYCVRKNVNGKMIPVGTIPAKEVGEAGTW
jgi:hypothetical protein